jgi:hypothetical protein
MRTISYVDLARLIKAIWGSVAWEKMQQTIVPVVGLPSNGRRVF